MLRVCRLSQLVYMRSARRLWRLDRLLSCWILLRRDYQRCGHYYNYSASSTADCCRVCTTSTHYCARLQCGPGWRRILQHADNGWAWTTDYKARKLRDDTCRERGNTESGNIGMWDGDYNWIFAPCACEDVSQDIGATADSP
jgi:hypothetical protein